MTDLADDKELTTSPVAFREAYFAYQLQLLFHDRCQFVVNDHQIILKVTVDKVKRMQMYLLDNQLPLMALVNSYWAHERYCVANLFTTFFASPNDTEFITHKIEVLKVTPAVFSADCHSYANDQLIAESSIVCERELYL
jgi:hypothetical protein